jgi:hypothetical protein
MFVHIPVSDELCIAHPSVLATDLDQNIFFKYVWELALAAALLAFVRGVDEQLVR